MFKPSIFDYSLSSECIEPGFLASESESEIYSKVFLYYLFDSTIIFTLCFPLHSSSEDLIDSSEESVMQVSRQDHEVMHVFEK